MLGFHAEARTTEITIDYGELEDARWFDHTRAAWEARFDRLERFLATTETKGDDHER